MLLSPSEPSAAQVMCQILCSEGTPVQFLADVFGLSGGLWCTHGYQLLSMQRWMQGGTGPQDDRDGKL